MATGRDVRKLCALGADPASWSRSAGTL